MSELSESVQDEETELPESVTDHEDGTYSVELSKPISRGGVETATIKSHEATVADLEAGDKAKGDVGRGVALVAALFNVPLSFVRKMRPRDFNAACAVVEQAVGK